MMTKMEQIIMLNFLFFFKWTLKTEALILVSWANVCVFMC